MRIASRRRKLGLRRHKLCPGRRKLCPGRQEHDSHTSPVPASSASQWISGWRRCCLVAGMAGLACMTGLLSPVIPPASLESALGETATHASHTCLLCNASPLSIATASAPSSAAGNTLPDSTQSAESDSLDLATYLRHLLRDHPFSAQQALAARQMHVKREQFRAVQDWRLTTHASYAYSEPVENSTFAPEELSHTSLAANLGRGFWATGGRLSLEWETSYTDQVLPTIPFPDLGSGAPPGGATSGITTGAPIYHRHRLMVRFDQPLLQNRGGSLDQLAFDLGGFGAVVGSLRAAEEQEQFLGEMGRLFLEWVALREREAIARERLDLAQEQVDYTARRREANLVDEADLLRAEQAFHEARGQVEALAAQTEALAHRLSLLTGFPNLHARAPHHDLYAQHDSLPSYEELAGRIEKQSRSLQMLQLQIDQAERSLRAHAERTHPELDLQLGAGVLGGDRDLGSSFEMDHPELSVGLMFSHPLGARVATTQEEVATLEVRRLRRQRDYFLDELRSSVRATRHQLRRLHDVLVINHRALTLARDRAREEQALYRQGRQPLLFVIEAQDDVQRTRMTLLENATTYQAQLLLLWELVDELLPAASHEGRVAERMFQ